VSPGSWETFPSLTKAPKSFGPRRAICKNVKAHPTKLLFEDVSNTFISFINRKFFVYKIQCELSCPKSARKVWGLSRNARQGTKRFSGEPLYQSRKLTYPLPLKLGRRQFKHNLSSIFQLETQAYSPNMTKWSALSI